MKKRLSFLLALVICVSLFSGVLTTGAYALDATAGVYCEFKLYDTCAWDIKIDKFTYSIVPGMSYQIRNNDTELWIYGTPEKSGTWSLTGHVYTKDLYGAENMEYYNIPFNVGAGSSTTNINKSVTVDAGKNVSEDMYSGIYGQLSGGSGTKTSWNGLSLENNGSCVSLRGTPQSAGTQQMSITVQDGSVTVNVSVNVTVKEAVVPFEVTKSPSGETVTEGGNALFISSATGYSDIEWRVVTKDGNNCWRGKREIESYFPGVNVSIYKNDAGQECLYLTNIPLSMNGYYIQTKFWSTDKSATKFTSDHSCLLTVKEATLAEPKITGQPQGVELETGKTTTLSVTASSPDGNTLKYQWYKNNTNSTAGGQAISGATFSTYTPEQLEGTWYYFCAVYNTKGDKTSAAVNSSVAAVKYTAAPQPTATPAVTPSPSPEPQTTPEPIEPVTTPAPNNGPGKTGNSHEQESEKKDHTVLFVVAGLVAVALVCGTVIYLKTAGSRRRPEDEYEYQDEYQESYPNNYQDNYQNNYRNGNQDDFRR